MKKIISFTDYEPDGILEGEGPNGEDITEVIRCRDINGFNRGATKMSFLGLDQQDSVTVRINPLIRVYKPHTNPSDTDGLGTFVYLDTTYDTIDRSIVFTALNHTYVGKIDSFTVQETAIGQNNANNVVPVTLFG